MPNKSKYLPVFSPRGNHFRNLMEKADILTDGEVYQLISSSINASSALKDAVYKRLLMDAGQSEFRDMFPEAVSRNLKKFDLVAQTCEKILSRKKYAL